MAKKITNPSTAKPGGSRRKRFEAEVSPLMDGIYRAALRLARDPTQSEDLLQETVLKAYRFFDSYKSGTNFRAWIFRILYTVFINRTRDRGPKMAPLPELAEPAAQSSGAAEELDRSTHNERVAAVLESVDSRIKQAVDDLPPDLRMVFLLSTVEGLKYKEIAEVMECPLGTVMSRLFRSRKLLQDRLSDYASQSGFDVQGSTDSIDP